MTRPLVQCSLHARVNPVVRFMSATFNHSTISRTTSKLLLYMNTIFLGSKHGWSNHVGFRADACASGRTRYLHCGVQVAQPAASGQRPTASINIEFQMLRGVSKGRASRTAGVKPKPLNPKL
eukprot:7495476-Lingulodinium_polyedra.AAC.1